MMETLTKVLNISRLLWTAIPSQIPTTSGDGQAVNWSAMSSFAAPKDSSFAR
jgi:hypothetical protein